MTYLEAYMRLGTPEEIKQMAERDTKVAIFIGNNPDRLKAIEDAMNEAVRMMEVKHES